jgi:hypothetical protein
MAEDANLPWRELAGCTNGHYELTGSIATSSTIDDWRAERSGYRAEEKERLNAGCRRRGTGVIDLEEEGLYAISLGVDLEVHRDEIASENRSARTRTTHDIDKTKRYRACRRSGEHKHRRCED